MLMAELKNYIEGQMVECSEPLCYTTIEEQTELKAYREFGTLTQLRVLCDNYHEFMNRPTEAEIREKAHQEFYDKVLNFEDYIEPITEMNGVHLYSGRDITYMVRKMAEQLKEGQ